MNAAVSWEAIAGLSSAVIALCALGLTIWQGMLSRRHNRLSVRPHLVSWDHSDGAKACYTLEVMNNGLGPAIIEDFYVEIDGQKVSGAGCQPIEAALKVVFPDFQYRSVQSGMSRGYVMPANEKKIILDLTFFGAELPTRDQVVGRLEKARLVIQYRSMYGEPFKFDSDEREARPWLS